MKKLATIVAAGGLALGLSACGGAENEAEQAVQDFGAAVGDKDYEAICDSFDPELVEAMEQGGQDCPKAFEENWDQLDVPADAEEFDIQESEISEDEKTATVTIKTEDDKEEEIPLKKIEDEWKISIGDM